jgi:uncharacterized Zn finger protein (UPF0148 family)
MDPETIGCPNCGAPVALPIGEVEAVCEYCSSLLRFVPEAEELEVVRTREEMKYRERVAVQQQILRNKLEQEEMERWRQTAARVAIAAVPIVGRTAGRAAFDSALRHGGGCTGCGCLGLIGLVAGLLALI